MPTKVCLVKAMVFPVVMYGCESWTVKKAEHQRNKSMKNKWWQINSVRQYFWAPKSLQMVTAAMKLKDAYSLEEKL